jgi:light-regulated signal transduction histidine kinase (bacteriophytochrome)
VGEYIVLKAAHCLKKNKEKVLTLWSERARQEISAASHKSELVLRDALPLFINNLVRALSPNEPDDDISETLAAKEHAGQRDQQGDYSLAQVLAEYFILQKTLFEVLEVETGAPLSNGDRDTVLESIALAVKEAGAEFAKLQMSRLQKSNEALVHFAHIASHDMQEPLRTIGTFLSLIQKELAGGLTQELTEYFNFAIDATKRMTCLIDGLLSYSQVGHTELKMIPTDFNLAFEHSLSNLQAAIKESDARVTSDSLPTLPALPSEIERLFQNLFSNAIKFRSSKPLTIHVSAVHNGKNWLFSVSDNGIGIEPKHREQIFNIFSRLHSNQKIPGSGIGLSVCRRVAELHRGAIWADANPEGGTTFKFSIPATSLQ